jgi:exopolysaccharide biosynthesis polyprenyl glycosylphosphotransferase
MATTRLERWPIPRRRVAGRRDRISGQVMMNSPEAPIDLPDQPHSRLHWYGGLGFTDRVLVTDFNDLSGDRGGAFEHNPSTARPSRAAPPRTAMPDPVSVVSARRAASPAPPKVDIHLQTEVSLRQRVGSLHVNDILPIRQFLKLLRLEKRRAERSNTKLSIVHFRLDRTYGDEFADVKGLLDVVHSSKRETDRLGFLDDDLIALILPDTSEQGAQAFVQSIKNRVRALNFTTASMTYPDQLVEYVRSGQHDQLSTHYPLFLGDPEPRRARDFFKRGLDIIGACVAIVVFSPLMLIIAAAIKRTSPGPIVFKQTRLGCTGVPFVFYKFRSMSLNSDDRIHREYVASLIKGDHAAVNQGDAAKPIYKIKSDPRVTRIGSILRKTSMDELPQLFNVVKGDMSLVGPRPPIPYEAEKYEPWHLRRILEIKPGITGLWQVEGRSKTSFDDMVRLDLRYVRNCSLLLDVKILLKTFAVVLKREGAT